MIGEAIKEYRERRGFSREELGRRCGFGCDGEIIIEAFERDEGFPDLEKLKKWQKHYLCPWKFCARWHAGNAPLKRRWLSIWKMISDMKQKEKYMRTQTMKGFSMTIWIKEEQFI